MPEISEKRFKVIVRNIEELFQQFHKPNRVYRDFDGNSQIMPYELGSAALSVPMRSVSVSALSNGKEFELRAYIGSAEKPKETQLSCFDSHYPLNIPRNLGFLFVTEKVSEDAVYILDNNNEPEFVVTKDVLLSSMYISAGMQGALDRASVPPKSLTTFEKFEKDIKKFAEIIEVVVNGIYEDERKDSSHSTLFLQLSVIDSTLQAVSQDRPFGSSPELLQKAIEVKKPNVRFDEIGGLDFAKREVQGLSFAIKNPALYKKWGTKPPKGILLYGPPGTGKTLLAKALASEADAKFYHVKVTDITSKWYSESEKLTQAVFDIAKSNGPSIIFFDEIDALGSQRDDSHEATRRILSVMLENLDGLDSSENIMVVAATNRPTAIDPALKRPGRLDRLVEVPLPDSEGRRQIFSVHIAKAEKIAEKKLFNDIDFKQILEKTDKMSGADIAEIIRRVLEEKVHKEGIGEKLFSVITEDILQEISNYERIKSSMSEEEIKKCIL